MKHLFQMFLTHLLWSPCIRLSAWWAVKQNQVWVTTDQWLKTCSGFHQLYRFQLLPCCETKLLFFFLIVSQYLDSQLFKWFPANALWYGVEILCNVWFHCNTGTWVLGSIVPLAELTRSLVIYFRETKVWIILWPWIAIKGILLIRS